MKAPPWASGPGEILRHGLSLLDEDSDVNRRIAMILIDNAVELMIKTYLGLPRRVKGIRLSRKEYTDISESFPRLLDALEQHAIDKLKGIDLGEIEWYHRIRNELYHQGNGLTVERNKVEIYAELAKLLFRNLFDCEIPLGRSDTITLLDEFLSAWVRFEQVITTSITKVEKSNGPRPPISPLFAVRKLADMGIIDYGKCLEIKELIHLRNQIIHGEVDYKTALSPEVVMEIKKMIQNLQEPLKSSRQDE